MTSITRCDGVISFDLEDTTFMYYNITRQCITVLAVKPPFNMRTDWPVDSFLFYNFHEDIKHPKKLHMTFSDMCASVITILEYHNVDVPFTVDLRTT